MTSRWLAVARGHPRHVVLFAFAAGLLAGPLWPPGAPLAALLAAGVARPPVLSAFAAAAVLAGAVVADVRLAALDARQLLCATRPVVPLAVELHDPDVHDRIMVATRRPPAPALIRRPGQRLERGRGA